MHNIFVPLLGNIFYTKTKHHMALGRFLRNYLVLEYRNLFDFFSVFFAFFCSILFSILETIFFYRDVSSLFARQEKTISFFSPQIGLFFVFNLFLMFVLCFLFRFFINMIISDHNRDRQRTVSLMVSFSYVFICNHFIFRIDDTPAVFQLRIKYIVFLFFTFIFYCLSIALVKNKFFRISSKKMFLILGWTLCSICALDWFVISYTRKKIERNLAHQNIFFIFYGQHKGPVADGMMTPTTWPQLQDRLQNAQKHGQKLTVNTVGSTAAWPFLSNLGIPTEDVCKPDTQHLMRYRMFQSTLPLVALIPARISAALFTKNLCLNLGQNFPDILLFSLYYSIMQAPQPTYQIVFVDWDRYGSFYGDIIQHLQKIWMASPQTARPSFFYVAKRDTIGPAVDKL